MQPQQNLNNQASMPRASQTGATVPRRRKRLGGMTWILIAIAVLFVIGGILTAMRKNVAPTERQIARAPLSYIGVNTFENAAGGVMIRDVWPPDSPADKAGLVGGDIINAFDNHATVDEDEMMRLLATTPPGKNVEIIYTRDGKVKKVTLTTISRSEKQHLDAVFDERETGWAQFGYDDGQAEVVPVPGRKINGVQLHGLSSSGPATLAGIQEGDIVVEFDGTPIRTTSELVLRVRRATPYSVVKVVVIRGTEQLEIPVKMGKRG
jgi:S1-C subfamily serine protease